MGRRVIEVYNTTKNDGRDFDLICAGGMFLQGCTNIFRQQTNGALKYRKIYDQVVGT